MNISRLFTFALTLAAVIALRPALAQQDEAETAVEPQRYQLELLMFTHRDQSKTTAEIPRMPKAEIADILEQELAIAAANPPGSAEPEADDTSGLYWQSLDPAQYKLNDVADRLNRVAAYDLLLHLGWQQTAPDVSEASKVDLAELGVSPDLISGTVNLFQRRYLHLALDLRLNDGNRSDNASGSFGDSLQLFRAPPSVPAITDSRRIRLEELHYFDQPEFGIIAMVARVE